MKLLKIKINFINYNKLDNFHLWQIKKNSIVLPKMCYKQIVNLINILFPYIITLLIIIKRH